MFASVVSAYSLFRFSKSACIKFADRLRGLRPPHDIVIAIVSRGPPGGYGGRELVLAVGRGRGDGLGQILILTPNTFVLNTQVVPLRR